MLFFKNRNLIRWIIVIASFAIISLILWNTYVFFQKFKAEERIKIENWTFAQNELFKVIDNNELNENIDVNTDLIFKILSSNNTTPIIVVNKDSSIYSFSNIGKGTKADSIYVIKNLKKLIHQFSQENTPIKIKEVNQTLYYANSPLLNKLKYYPLALLLIIILFGAVVYFFYRSNKTAIENKLWSGMAKETAHQIGTPLSSLIGWTEILKTENTNPEYIKEIEKDINRLQTITERFSKIGSLPKLEKTDIVAETIASYDYLKARSSKLIDFEIIVPNHKIFVNLNKQLFSWTIENLVKNGIDAMKGKGKLKIEIIQLENNISINITDSGKGLAKHQFKTVFEPGYTTKKRGWGLGLSLAKRIIEEFHDGKIKVLHSEIDKGTTMQIALKSI
ncbi:HAMP domain-containing histidine kinase [Lacinutrix sp. C3R15]|uniref:sensor histidine kinase n=1 Tax=Flavobacteriaceae TaxID=49546 RepID=UPI001C08E6BC|nr:MULTISPECIES: HAMP domain-containing sensor histidine kinase [Flavobacteriaceae]MBU2939017.1 HAMP domain-containing histidine kinase [Lacinutrix sp. C3R15]MDO6622332.1 HAMP domain-containing sensor histidine kinase [Oceanihabitans sp. 1_MG-2023]